MNRLHITQVETKSTPSRISKAGRAQEVQAVMERLWLEDPEQFSPFRDCAQRRRYHQTIEVINEYLSLENKLVADLGCGSGDLSCALRDKGAKVDALDVASNALERLKQKETFNITPIQGCLPSTRLDDNRYDLVICTEVIGHLKPQEYRLLFAELSRLVTLKGFVVCSTSLDINSDNALERFITLAETELQIEKSIVHYDRLWVRWCQFFETPQLYAKASKDLLFYQKQLMDKKGLSKFWFILSASNPLVFFWKGIALFANPLANYFRQSASMMNMLEKATRFFWSYSGASHVLLIGKRRPMTFPLPADKRPQELKHKRQTWE